METSFANGGQISVSHAEPWANPHTPFKALRWLGREDAPLLFRLRWDPALFDWSRRFLAECRPGRTRANIRAIVAIALHSRNCLKALRRELSAAPGGLDYDQRERGILHIYTDAQEFTAASRASAVMRAHGCDRQMKTVAECIAIEPALADIGPRLVGGDYTADDESGDALKFTQALVEHCRRHGVEFRFGASIDGLTAGRDGIESVSVDGRPLTADAYVVALGSYSPRLVRPLGLKLPIYPAKGYSATIPLGPDSVAPTVSLTDDEYRIVLSRLGDRLRVAGTAEFNGYDTELNSIRCQLLVRRAGELFPQLRPAGEPVFWAGLRPATPSNVPLIGRTRIPGCGSTAATARSAGRWPAVRPTPWLTCSWAAPGARFSFSGRVNWTA